MIKLCTKFERNGTFRVGVMHRFIFFRTFSPPVNIWGGIDEMFESRFPAKPGIQSLIYFSLRGAAAPVGIFNTFSELKF